MTNQSELRLHVSDILTGWLGDSQYNGFDVDDYGGLSTELVDYINANYTPNSEVERLVSEAYKKGYIASSI